MKMLASASVLGRVELGSFSCSESDDGSHDVHLGFASSRAPCFFFGFRSWCPTWKWQRLTVKILASASAPRCVELDWFS